MKKSIITLSFLFVLALISAGVADASHTWGKYHWNISTEQSEVSPLVLGDNFTTDAWKSSLGLASVDWNNSVLKNAVAGGTSNANCDPTLGQVEVCNGEYGENGWLGIAQLWAYRGKDAHIAQAIVKLNDTYFSLPQYDSTAWRNFVVCQEVGHTFGLDHQDENFSNTNLGTCMDYTSDPDGSVLGQLDNQYPNAHDYEMLTSIYAHVNDTSSGGNGNGKGGGKGRPAAAGVEALNGPAQWGQAVSQDAQGRDSLFVRNLGNGIEVITHVLWAQ